MFTAKDIAEALNQNERSVRRRAGQESWSAIPRADKLGGRLFPLAHLPSNIQTALVRKYGQRVEAIPGLGQLDREALWARYGKLGLSNKEEAARRQKILMDAENLVDQGWTRNAAFAKLAAHHEETERTLYRWRQMVEGLHRADWLAALAPAHTGRIEREIPAEAWDWFKADFLRLEAPALSACYERLSREAKARGWTLPCLKTFHRRVADLPWQLVMLCREGTKALERSYPAQERDHSVFGACEAVNADGHKFDVFVKWEDGSIDRPMMVAWQDIFSGKILSYRVDKTESRELVRLALADLLSQYRIPTHVYLDNGRAFASKWMTGGMKHRFRFKVKEEEPTGILTQLGCAVHWTTPYHGQAKPIERAFRDLCEYVAKHPLFAGAYTGNKPTAKPENYGSTAIPIEEFLRVLDEEIHYHNAREGRRSQVCQGGSFDQVFYQSLENSTLPKATSGQVHMLMLAADAVKPSRTDGAIHLHGNRYWSEEVARAVGKNRVVVRFDPQNLHSSVFVYSLAGEFLGEAPVIQAVGFADTEAAKTHATARKRYKKSIKEFAASELGLAQIKRENIKALPPEEPEVEQKVVGLFTPGIPDAPTRERGKYSQDDIAAFRAGVDRQSQTEGKRRRWKLNQE